MSWKLWVGILTGLYISTNYIIKYIYFYQLYIVFFFWRFCTLLLLMIYKFNFGEFRLHQVYIAILIVKGLPQTS